MRPKTSIAVLDYRDLPSQTRELVCSAYGEIKAEHDDISRVKHELH